MGSFEEVRKLLEKTKELDDYITVQTRRVNYVQQVDLIVAAEEGHEDSIDDMMEDLDLELRDEREEKTEINEEKKLQQKESLEEQQSSDLQFDSIPTFEQKERRVEEALDE